MTSPLALSPHAHMARGRFGAEGQPLITVNDALVDAESVVGIAARHDFAPIGPFYPGIRAAVSAAVAMHLVAPLLSTLEQTFGLTRPPRFRECFLSIVTTPAGALSPIQRLPHFDGTESERLAVLLYLDRAERGGTAFYRQRETGFESVSPARFDRYRQALEQGVAAHGMPGAGYIGGDTALFEEVQVVAGRFNRMVIYRGNTLHCARLSPGFVPDPDPAPGRLTLNLFLD